MIGADKVFAIRAKAEALAGRSLGDQGTALTEMAAQRACAWCCREDIPAEMEQAVAALVAEQFPKAQPAEIFWVGTTIGSHTGPGTVALFYESDGHVV